MARLILIFGLATVGCIASVIAQETRLTRDQKVRLDKKTVEAKGFWIYNDLELAISRAQESGKPILVALRCIPCEECVKLDDELVDTDPIIRPLLQQFECVRLVSTNGLDLDTFQYDTDQSFAVFMLNADKTIYGRFGTRSHHSDWSDDVSLAGMAEALRGALELHRNYPSNAASLAGKRGSPLEFKSPEQYPAHRDKYTNKIDYTGNVVQSCIHCHQIGDARREYFWHQGKPIPEELIFPYPHPKSIGLILDPTHRALVKKVAANSPAEAAGLQTGDSIVSMNGQPILSIADVQWLLQNTPPEGGMIELEVERSAAKLKKRLTLDANWRRSDDITWRVASWQMRRIATGGLQLKELDADRRRELGIANEMALEVAYVGQYDKHAAAKNAGIQLGDIVISFDGRNDLQRESDLFTYVSQNKHPGDRVQVDVLRREERITLELPIQK